MGLTVVLGGARCGKSAWAETLVASWGGPVRYVATADAGAGMRERIARHRARRPAAWETVQAGPTLDVLGGDATVLVDGLGVWLASALHHGWRDPLAQVRRFVRDAAGRLAPVVLVIEEAGAGVLPADPQARAWVDLVGEASQLAVAASTRAVLVVAGRAIELPPATAAAPPPSVAPPLRTHGDRLVPAGAADHAVSVVADGPPPWLREALRADVSAYPRDDDAVAATAARHRRAPEEVVPTNGAAEALWLLPAALRPRHAAVVHPGFTESEAALHAHGVPVTRVLRAPEDGFAVDPAAVPADADLVIVGNPASPSGTLVDAATILSLRRPGRTIVVDEAFMDLVAGETGSLAADAPADVIVVRSLTKVLSVPGVRVGYALAARPLAERLRAVRPPWSANAVALAVLRAAAEHVADIAAIARRARGEREDLERRLDDAGIRRWPAAANFVLTEPRDGALERARRAGIAVRPCDSFPGLTAGHVRITAREPGANARLVEALA